jgi:catechol 2,3-dioxygenase-like lactoylglutathione lyase family enzyme
MSIVPLIHSTNMSTSIDFYTNVLDFELVFTSGKEDHPSFSVLKRKDGYIHISSFSGDGIAGNAFSVIVTNIDELFRFYVSRGLRHDKPGSPVHQGPLEQTWGTREFYADDPDGNTIRYIQPKE